MIIIIIVCIASDVVFLISGEDCSKLLQMHITLTLNLHYWLDFWRERFPLAFEWYRKQLGQVQFRHI